MDLSIPREDKLWLYRKEDVFSVLKHLYQNDTLLTIFYKNIFCLSTVVDYDHNYLWLDSSSTQEGVFLSKQPQIYLLSSNTTIPYFMELHNCKSILMDNKPTWQFDLPTRVHKRQRRDSFRVYFPMSIPNSVTLGDSPEKMYLSDLSMTGLGLISDASNLIELEKIYNLKLVIPAFQKINAIDINFNIIVKYISDILNGKKKIGVQFVELSRQHEMLLSKWQHHLQLTNKNRD